MEQDADKPGKIRTWWHPLLASFLRWQLGSHYQLYEEVPVGKKPLQIDILLLHREQGELSAQTRKILAGLVEYLNDFTLLELKSPSDTLRAGDFQTFLAYALLYRAQNEPALDPSRLTLIVIAPHMSGPYAEELRLLGVTVQREQDGIWRLHGGTLGHPAWLLETAVLAGLNHPLLTLLSPLFLRQGARTYEELRRAGYTELVVYMAQQIQQFQRLGKEFAMQHFGSEDEMRQAMRDILAAVPPEELRECLSVEERLKGLSPEERLKGLAPKQLRQALPLEKRFEELSPEEQEYLKDLLQRQTKTDDPSHPR